MRVACWVLAGMLAFGWAPAARPDPTDHASFTDFTGLDAQDPASFVLDGAQFSGGDAFFVGVSALYFLDDRAWIVGAGGTATILFPEPASIVELYAVGLDGARVRALGTVIGPSEFDVTGSDIEDPTQRVLFIGEITGIELENTSMGNPADFATTGAALDQLGWSGLGAGAPIGRCRAAQLKATASFCKLEMGCFVRRLKKPENDPDGSLLAECRARARSRLDAAQARALAKAARSNSVCALADAATSFVESALGTPLEALRDTQLLVSFDPALATPEESKLRAALVKAAGRACQRALAAEARNARSSDPERLAEKRARVRDKLARDIARAQERGARKGAPDPGVDPAAVEAALDALVDGVVGLTAGP